MTPEEDRERRKLRQRLRRQDPEYRDRQRQQAKQRRLDPNWRDVNLPKHASREAARREKNKELMREKRRDPAFRQKNNEYAKRRDENRTVEQRLLHRAKADGPRRGLEVNIELADIQVPDYCPVFGFPLDRFARHRAPNQPSLDRVDNERGYVKGNVRVISFLANNLKRELNEHEALAIAEYIIAHKELKK